MNGNTNQGHNRDDKAEARRLEAELEAPADVKPRSPGGELIKGLDDTRKRASRDLDKVLAGVAESTATRLGLAMKLLMEYGGDFLIAREREGYLEYTCQVLLLQSGGSWSDDAGIFCRRVEELAVNITKAIEGKITAAKTKAEKSRLRSLLRSWRGLCRAWAAPKRRYELANAFAHAVDELNKRGIDFTAPRECLIDDLSHNFDWLGAPNGIVNLCTGEFIADRDEAADMLVVGCLPDDYNPLARSGTAARLVEHLEPDLRMYLLQWLGVALRSIPDREFLVLLGEGGGGKTTLMNALKAAFGINVSRVSADAFAKRRGSGGIAVETEALVAPKRIALMPEANQAVYHTETLKNYAGGDVQSWRRPYEQAMREDVVVATLLMAANELPSIDVTDKAMKDRLYVLPYPGIPESERDKDMRQAFYGKRNAEAVAARQTLVSMIVRAGMQVPDGQAPIAPPAVIEATREAYESLIGEGGMWILDNVKRGMANATLSSTAVWEALCDAFGKEHDTKIVGGIGRQRCTRLVSGMHGPTKSVWYGGKPARGWKGLVIADE